MTSCTPATQTQYNESELVRLVDSLQNPALKSDEIISASVLKYNPDAKTVFFIETKGGKFILTKENSARCPSKPSLRDAMDKMRRLYILGFPVPKIIGDIQEYNNGAELVYLQTYQSGRQNAHPSFAQACGITAILARMHSDTMEQSTLSATAGEVIPCFSRLHEFLEKTEGLRRDLHDGTTQLQEPLEVVFSRRISNNLGIIHSSDRAIRKKSIFSAKAAAILLDDAFNENILSFLKALEATVIKNSGSLPRSIIHSDPNPTNMLFDDKDNVSGLLDFEWSSSGAPIVDLAQLIATLGAKSKNPRTFAFDPEKVKAIVSVYNLVRPLTPEEHEILPPLVASCYLESYLCDASRYVDLANDRIPSKLTDLERRKQLFEMCLKEVSQPDFKRSLMPGAIPMHGSSIFSARG